MGFIFQPFPGCVGTKKLPTPSEVLGTANKLTLTTVDSASQAPIPVLPLSLLVANAQHKLWIQRRREQALDG